MIDIKIHMELHYFLRGFCGEDVKKNAAIFNKKLYSSVES